MCRNFIEMEENRKREKKGKKRQKHSTKPFVFITLSLNPIRFKEQDTNLSSWNSHTSKFKPHKLPLNTSCLSLSLSYHLHSSSTRHHGFHLSCLLLATTPVIITKKNLRKFMVEHKYSNIRSYMLHPCMHAY